MGASDRVLFAVVLGLVVGEFPEHYRRGFFGVAPTCVRSKLRQGVLYKLSVGFIR